MVDALLASVDRARARSTVSDLGLEPGGYGIVTLAPTVERRRPGGPRGDPEDRSARSPSGFRSSCRPIRAPPPASVRPTTPARLRVVDPLGYLDFLALQAAAAVVLTDSGGVQEETTVLGIPCLTLRDSTERPITVTEGTNRVVGRDRSAILAACGDALAGNFPIRRPPLWDGKAGERIAEVLVSVDHTTMCRPTDSSGLVASESRATCPAEGRGRRASLRHKRGRGRTSDKPPTGRKGRG